MIDLTNLQEDVVRSALEQLLETRPDVCSCEKCMTDMMVYALNRVPPRYVARQRGKTFSRISVTDTQGRTSVLAAVLNAIKHVSQTPHAEFSQNETQNES